jgi:hypothetical protein
MWKAKVRVLRDRFDTAEAYSYEYIRKPARAVPAELALAALRRRQWYQNTTVNVLVQVPRRSIW